MMELVIYTCPASNSHKHVALQDEEVVLKMHYEGHRLLNNERKVYCLHAEKMNPNNTEEIGELLDYQDNRKATGIQPSCSTTPRVQRREAMERNKGAKRSKAQLVPQKTAQLRSTSNDGQKISRKRKSTPERYEGTPYLVKNVVQAPYQHQQGKAGASSSKQQALNPPQQQRQQQPQHQQYQKQRQVVSTVQLADQVSEALLNHPRLDKNLVCKYLPVFSRLTDKTSDIDGKNILKLAEEPSGAGLQIFLEASLQQHA